MSLTPRLPLSRTRLDRDATSRQIPGFIEGLWAREDTRVVCVWKGEVLTRSNDTLHLDYRATTDLPAPDVAVYLGKTLEGDPLGADVPIVAAVYSDVTASEILFFRLEFLRQAKVQRFVCRPLLLSLFPAGRNRKMPYLSSSCDPKGRQ